MTDNQEIVGTYKVEYIDGIEKYGDAKKYNKMPINMNIYEDRLVFEKTDWFDEITVFAKEIKKIKITSAESIVNLFGSTTALSAAALFGRHDDTLNVINVYLIDEGEEKNFEKIVRFKMVSGSTVEDSVEKAKEFLDLLDYKKISDKFLKNRIKKDKDEFKRTISKLRSLAELKKEGTITEDEFSKKKRELLARIWE